MDISNWVATLKINQGEVTLQPCQLALNGAPIQAGLNINLNQPGYVYKVNLQADKVALGPLADTFAPDKRGQVQGNLNVNAAIRGAGVTGANLQKNLQGQWTMALTNMNVQVVGGWMKTVLTPVAIVLQLNDLLTSPVDHISSNGTITNGVVNLQPFTAASPAFIATAQGTITLATILTNSTLNLPVDLALPKGLAAKIKLNSLQPKPGTDFVSLPQFVKVGGTVGIPKTETDKLKIAGLLAGSVAGAVNGGAGNIVQGVGGLLRGENPFTSGTITNAIPAAKTNSPAKLSPLDLLRGLVPPK